MPLRVAGDVPAHNPPKRLDGHLAVVRLNKRYVAPPLEAPSVCSESRACSLHGRIGEPALSERVDVAIERGRDGVVVEVPLVPVVGRDTHVVA